MSVDLRPYQEGAVERLRQAIRRGFRRILLVSPTGSGKTVIFCYLVSRLVAVGKRVAILDHRQELTEQISRALTMVGVPHGIIAGAMQYAKNHLAHVCSIGTLVRRLDRVEVPDYVVVDEAHHCIEDSMWGKSIAHWRALNPNLIVIGVTATPERLDGAGLGQVFDTMVMGPTTAELIADGYLAPYRLFMPPPQQQVDTSQLHHQGGDFKRSEAATLMSSGQVMGSVVEHYRRHVNGAPGVAFCVSVDHALQTAARFESAGFRAASVDGKMDKQLRNSVINDFGAGQLNVLTSCDLISEGFDVPGIIATMHLRPTESLGLHLQQTGRGFRPMYAPGFDLTDRASRLEAIARGPKPHFIMLDHANNTKTHGLPDDEREWSLEAVSRAKRKSDPDAMPIKQCKKCYAIAKSIAVKCAACGHPFAVTAARKVEEVEGDLKEVDPEVARQEFVRARAAADGLDALVQIGKMRGMKNPEGWAKHVLDAREAKKARKRGVAA